ncbi:MAG: tripartite tricarboxylate transporter TctB family protein [Deltaproteobacteria bacterium]|nr:tripartite tricarboxylate transporter TctB family protein [Deltaproteobacteria bacterium]
MIKIRNPKDLCAGLFFMVFGLSAVLISRTYPLGTAFRMGAGYFPILIGGILFLIGLVIVIKAFFGARESLSLPKWRPLLFIVISIILFGLMIKPLGLVVTAFIVVMTSGLAGERFHVREMILLATVLAVLSAVLFVSILGLPFPVWPQL